MYYKILRSILDVVAKKYTRSNNEIMKNEAEEKLKNKSRVYYFLKNVKVSLFFTLISFFLGFFSRKILLDRLGVEFIGLAGTLQSILGFLNIAELGICTAISYALYKPLAEGNQKKVQHSCCTYDG